MTDVPEQTAGAWSADEVATVLAAIERFGGATAPLFQDICERTGRSKPAVIRKLVKIGHLQTTRDGVTGYLRAYGHVR